MSFEVVNRFTYDVLNVLYDQQEYTGNVGFSGSVLYVVMAAISIGLRGRSYNELSAFLNEDFEPLLDNETWVNSKTARKWTSFTDKSKHLLNARQYFYHHGELYPRYEQILTHIFKLNHQKIDRSNQEDVARLILNKNIWDKIDWKVVEDSIFSDDKLLFISYINTEFRWTNEFDQHLNEEIKFDLNDGEYVHVEMMHQISKNLLYDPSNQPFKILFKAFDRTNLYAAIVLPKYAKTLHDVISYCNFEHVYIYFQESKEKMIDLFMPKFKISFEHDFVKAFKFLGVSDIFYNDSSDFGRMNNRSVTIGNIIQLTHFSVDEIGINKEFKMETSHTHDERSTKFVVNQRFLFLIYSNSDKIVHFAAVVNDPTL